MVREVPSFKHTNQDSPVSETLHAEEAEKSSTLGRCFHIFHGSFFAKAAKVEIG